MEKESRILFSISPHEVENMMKRKGVDIKNFADEVPVGNSMTFAAALYNAGLKS